MKECQAFEILECILNQMSSHHMLSDKRIKKSLEFNFDLILIQTYIIFQNTKFRYQVMREKSFASIKMAFFKND